MQLSDLVNQVGDFDELAPRQQIRLFGWFLHTQKAMETFTNVDVRQCFADLHIADPNVAKYLPRMVDYGDLVKWKGSFKLGRGVRNDLDAKYGVHQSVVQVSKLLADLPKKMPDIGEKEFLTETLKCYRIEAYRACVVMAWNLAYSHLVDWLLNDATRLSKFNAAIARRYSKKSSLSVSTYDDFLEELKESEVIEICNTAGLISSNIFRILKEKLGRRNTAAHPASVVIVQPQADDAITDLVNNVVLMLH